MYTNFDYEEEQQNIEDGINFYFNEFSSEVRNKLLSKNLPKPENLYDVFYPTVRNELIKKNESLYKSDLGELSEEIRAVQLSKIIENTFSLEEQSEGFRKSLLSRDILHKENIDKIQVFEQKRKDLLSKNIVSISDLLKDSELYRVTNISKNVQSKSNLDDEQKIFRDNNVVQNNNKEENLDVISYYYRKDNLSKNVSQNNDVDNNSDEYRKNNLTKNVSQNSDLEAVSSLFRENTLSKNDNLKNNSLEKDSIEPRSVLLSKNVVNSSDLDKDSLIIRDSNLTKNVSNNTNLDDYSNVARVENIRKNVSNNNDLEKDSEVFRSSQTIHNVTDEKDLASISEAVRNSALIKNENVYSADLENSSLAYRNDSLSKNKNKQTDLEVLSDEVRKSNLSYNVNSDFDLQVDSNDFRKNNIQKNNYKETNLEKLSEEYRKDDLSVNKPIITDLETNSAVYREGNLSANKPVVTNLEANSTVYREDDLSLNKPIVSDLEANSVVYRKDDLSANIPVITNLETDSVEFRDDNLSVNIPVVTNLESDAVAFRENNLSINNPVITNLEIDSVAYRENILAANVSSVSNLEADSVTYRENNLDDNIPSISNLELDSVSYRENNLDDNIPSISNLELDSAAYRESNLDDNIPSTSNLELDSVAYRESNLDDNIPSTSNLEVDSTVYREDSLAANKPSEIGIDNHFDQYGRRNSAENERISNLNKNIGFGQLGFNVLGPGATSLYVGVSGVWAQGLIFRNLLTERNKYKGQRNYYTEDKSSLLKDTLVVPSQSQILNKQSLPITPYEFINANVYKNPEITSPIVRNLTVAFNSAMQSKEDLKFFKISDANRSVVYGSYGNKVDYNLGNQKNIGVNFGLISEGVDESKKLPANNINNLIRQYLKYSNYYVLDDFGKLTSEKLSPASIYDQILQLNQESIQDLIFAYNIFQNIRTQPKSLVADNNGVYFEKDAETYFKSDDSIIAAKDTAGNPFDVEFEQTKKGVKKVLRTIASDTRINFSQNFNNIQDNKIFITGKNKDGSKRESYQKYTIKNPYSPNGARKFIFAIKNYSNNQEMYFPPYISNFQNSDTANWNSTNFLGRPEAVYTYNNSSRDGSITFYILTDYAENVLIGDNKVPNVESTPYSINKNFTDFSSTVPIENDEKISEVKQLKLQINEIKNNIGEETEETADAKLEISNLEKKITALENEISQQQNIRKTVYAESNNANVNVYNTISQNEPSDGEYESKLVNTRDRLDTMISSLMFQPAYFSGNLIDFKRKLEFLSKLTRPASNVKTGSGFSFTIPPVCHLKLGDWINHDIIVNSVSYDYTDSPWTLEDGQNQPMWVNVTISFNIVGPAGESGGVPLTSTDSDGFFGNTTNR